MLHVWAGEGHVERKRNDDIMKELKVCVITGKVRECRLRWFGHLQKTEDGTPQ